MTNTLTRRQREIYDYLLAHQNELAHPPTLDELCTRLGLSSRGSLHKQVQALVEAGLVEPMHNKRRGIRLRRVEGEYGRELPMLGSIAAGRPIEAVSEPESIEIPPSLRSHRPCYVLRVKGNSMVEEGILDGDWVIIEQREHARNGEIVVALVQGGEATLKRIEQRPDRVVLHPANSTMEPLSYPAEDVEIQGVLVGQMRSYR